MVDDPTDQITWTENGQSFIVLCPSGFSDQLQIWFGHRKFSSFVRQLNMYGFHKILPRKVAGLMITEPAATFHHDLFRRNEPFLLRYIQRKKVRRISETQVIDHAQSKGALSLDEFLVLPAPLRTASEFLGHPDPGETTNEILQPLLNQPPLSSSIPSIDKIVLGICQSDSTILETPDTIYGPTVSDPLLVYYYGEGAGIAQNVFPTINQDPSTSAINSTWFMEPLIPQIGNSTLESLYSSPGCDYRYSLLQ